MDLTRDPDFGSVDDELIPADGNPVGATAEVLIDGAELIAPADCSHRAQINVNPLVAFIEPDPNDPDQTLRWEVRIRALCGECGLDFDVLPDARPAKELPGVVLTIHPRGESPA